MLSSRLSSPWPVKFKTYNGTDVFTIEINGQCVMKRADDKRVNATHILKLAGLKKGRRSKVLFKIESERHPATEKVQGGYGKFQGTWICLERAIALAMEYRVYELLKDLFQDLFKQISSDLPSNLESISKLQTLTPMDPSMPGELMQYRRLVPPKENTYNEQPPQISHHIASQQIQSNIPQPGNTLQIQPNPQIHLSGNQSIQFSSFEAHDAPIIPKISIPTIDELIDPQIYSSAIMCSLASIPNPDFVPSIFCYPPVGLDWNVILDCQGNTAFHWAAKQSLLPIMRCLSHKGADISLKNYHGETPLMLACSSNESYKRKSFHSIVDLLALSIALSDNKSQTVLHRLAAGKGDVEVYYASVLIEKIKKYCSNSVLDRKDCRGDTALHIAARAKAVDIAKLLVEAGASLTVENNNKMAPRDYGVKRMIREISIAI